jgi:hypothetical protein
MNGATIAIGPSGLIRAMARQRYLYFDARALCRAGTARAGWRAPPFMHGAGKRPEARAGWSPGLPILARRLFG